MDIGILDETIELLTRQMIEDVFNDKRNNNVQKIIMTKADLYKFCINLIKLLKRIEELED